MAVLGRSRSAFGIGAGGTITLNDVPAGGRIFNRLSSASSAGQPYMTGTYTGSVTSVEARVLSSGGSLIADWTALTASSFSSGVWSGRGPVVPTSSNLNYKFDARIPGSATIQSGANLWGIGINGLAFGQSNEGTFFTTGSTTIAPVPGTYIINGLGSSATPSSASGRSFIAASSHLGDGVLTMLNGLCNSIGCCVCMIDEHVAGVNINSLNGAMTNFVLGDLTYFMDGDLEFMHYTGNEQESIIYRNELSATEWWDYMAQIRDKLITLTGRSTFTIYLPSIGTDTAFTDVNGPGTQRINYEAETMVSNVYYAGTNMPCQTTDGIHMDASGSLHNGQRSVQTMLYHMGLSSKPSQWFITGANIQSSTVTRVTLTHSLGTDFTPISSITGFDVSGDGGASWTPGTGAQVDSLHIDVTAGSFSSAARMIRHMWGIAPTSTYNYVVDNSSINVPLNYTPTVIPCSDNVGVIPIVALQENAAISNLPMHISASAQKIPCSSNDLLCILVAQGAEADPTSITWTPNGSSALSFTKVVGSGSGGSCWTLNAPSGGVTSTNAGPLDLLWGGGIFTNVGYNVYILPGKTGAAPTGSVRSSATWPSTVSGSLSISSNGFVIAAAVSGAGSSQNVVIGGDRPFSNDSYLEGNFAAKTLQFGHTAGTSAGTLTVTAGATSDVGGMGLIAVSW